MDFLSQLFGASVEPKNLTILQTCARGVLIFLYSLFLIRLADKRFLSRKSAFDAVLGFILASMMARGVNGSAPLVPTLISGLLIVLLHRTLAFLAVRWHALGGLVKGTSDPVIRDGELLETNLRRNNFSKADMLEDLRLAGVASPDQVQNAHIERNVRISVIKK